MTHPLVAEVKHGDEGMFRRGDILSVEDALYGAGRDGTS